MQKCRVRGAENSGYPSRVGRVGFISVTLRPCLDIRPDNELVSEITTYTS